MTAQQSIAARRKAKFDPRYIGQSRKDPTRRAEREKAKAKAEIARRIRKKSK